MLASGVPYKFSLLPGSGAASADLTNPILPTTTSPVASQSLLYPPATAVPIGSGGTPPSIQDTNGLFAYLGLWANWFQAGAPVAWDSSFSSNFGGYPQGAIVASATTPFLRWLSTADSNTSDPDTGGANWVAYPNHGLVFIQSSQTWTVPEGITQIGFAIWAGGGGAGSSTVSGAAGAGAGAGAFAMDLIPVTGGTGIPITIGAGGAAGVGGGMGGSGGNSRIATAVCAGGTGGGGSTSGPSSSFGSGGTATGATIALPGGSGGPGLTIGGTGVGGYGGSGYFFPTTPALTTGNGGNGAISMGGGGGANSGTGGAGGPGAAILVW